MPLPSQVHDRAAYLRHLVSSLSKARGISDTLLVFSHDKWDDDVNDVIAGIEFARTMQIFYPYSSQAYPDEFPGESKSDCPRDIGKDRYEHF